MLRDDFFFFLFFSSIFPERKFLYDGMIIKILSRLIYIIKTSNYEHFGNITLHTVGRAISNDTLCIFYISNGYLIFDILAA